MKNSKINLHYALQKQYCGFLNVSENVKVIRFFKLNNVDGDNLDF